MELRFWINETEIEEPMGFDSFKAKIERGSEHGISAEVSVDSLEFYGNAADMVREAYNTDIDSQLIFKVELKCADTDEYSEIYRGLIDLSTYDELIASYCSVKCKVGEIGVRTTFNNRAETVLNLHNGVMIDLDGVDLASREIAREVTIPFKSLLLQSKLSCSVDLTSNHGIGWGFIYPVLDVADLSEHIEPIVSADNLWTQNLGNDSVNRYHFINTDNDNTYLDFSISASIFNKSHGSSSAAYLACGFVIYSNLNGVGSYLYRGEVFGLNGPVTVNPIWSGSVLVPANAKISAAILFNQDLDNPGYILTLTTKKDSFLKVRMLDSSENSNCDLALAHETLSRVSEVISGLTVKSDWYGRVNSGVNPLTSGVVGGGALKGLVKGLRLRNGDTNRINPTVINTSFKDLFLNLKAIDNVGWGFSEENGQLFIRVENWKWFYKNDVILTISNPKEKTRKLNEKSVYSRLKVGYEKYAAVEDINSVDTFHTERYYSSGLKAIDHEMSQLCKFIADPYIIEFTRRKTFEKDTKDWKYDENIFVFALRGAYANLPLYRSSGVLTANAYFDKIFVGTKLFFEGSEYVVTTYNTSTHVMTTTPTIRPGYNGGMNVLMTEVLNYGVEVGVDNSDNTVISPETMINFRLSPYRNASKFTDIIMQGNISKVFKLTSGTGNTTAKGKPNTATGTFYLTDPSGNNIVSENDSLTISNEPILKPETLEFEYPITIEQYSLIKQNPYGKIVVDGEPCYLDKFEYSFIEGLGNFSLIPAFE